MSDCCTRRVCDGQHCSTLRFDRRSGEYFFRHADAEPQHLDEPRRYQAGDEYFDMPWAGEEEYDALVSHPTRFARDPYSVEQHDGSQWNVVTSGATLEEAIRPLGGRKWWVSASPQQWRVQTPTGPIHPIGQPQPQPAREDLRLTGDSPLRPKPGGPRVQVSVPVPQPVSTAARFHEDQPMRYSTGPRNSEETRQLVRFARQHGYARVEEAWTDLCSGRVRYAAGMSGMTGMPMMLVPHLGGGGDGPLKPPMGPDTSATPSGTNTSPPGNGNGSAKLSKLGDGSTAPEHRYIVEMEGEDGEWEPCSDTFPSRDEAQAELKQAAKDEGGPDINFRVRELKPGEPDPDLGSDDDDEQSGPYGDDMADSDDDDGFDSSGIDSDTDDDERPTRHTRSRHDSVVTRCSMSRGDGPAGWQTTQAVAKLARSRNVPVEVAWQLYRMGSRG